MKKHKKLLSFFSLPLMVSVTAPLIMLTSCGNKVDLHVNIGEHITSYTVKEVSEKNNQIKIQFVFEEGYERFDIENLDIRVGGNKLTANDYILSNQTGVLIIKPSAVNNTNVTVNINSVASMVGMSIEYKSTDGFVALYDNTFLKGCVGYKFTPNNLNVKIELGDGSFVSATPGKQFNQYKITKNGKDITDDFIAGNIEFTDDMITGNEPEQLGSIFKVSYIEDTTKPQEQSLNWMYCGHMPKNNEGLSIVVEKTEISVGEELKLDTSTTVAKDYPDCNFQIVTGATATEAEIVENDEGEYFLKAGTVPGVATIRASSIFNTQIYVEQTITIQ